MSARPEIQPPSTSQAQAILAGFRLNSMTFRDHDTGEVLWRSSSNWSRAMFEREMRATVPARILQCKAVAREVNFSSDAQIEHFRIHQRLFFQSEEESFEMEDWHFEFGFVIPGSTNTWESIVEASDNPWPAELLNGRVRVETSFYDGNLLVSKSVVRVFYE
eukprot:gnl/Spiro4/9100_TR4793_c0_g1_i1.p1 gnl/Spiro4/9100_TR4793_c0_g1~~gnl/Spiro4/9100_TR4793_c0_g1_i1.p1  ORF type:complete len:186 (+),score=46.88 gnl/Spiro4/9100_TR4793_c0_g1_i1:75-560(+)